MPDFYDGMYDAGYDDPQDYMDALEESASRYLDSLGKQSYRHIKRKPKTEPKEERQSQFVDVDFLVWMKSTAPEYTNICIHPEVRELSNSSKQVVMIISVVHKISGEKYVAEVPPLKEANDKDIEHLPKQIHNLVLRFMVLTDKDERTGERLFTYLSPATWVGYSLPDSNERIVLSGKKRTIQYFFPDNDSFK